jgi:hypothetical protein
MNIPSVGSVIRVEVPNFSAMLTNPIFNDLPTSKFFEGTVIQNSDFDDPKSFCITTSNEKFPIRNILFKNVISINGASVDYNAQTTVKTVQVAGSNGNVYTVVINGEKSTCTCPQNTYRHQMCKHIKQVLEL